MSDSQRTGSHEIVFQSNWERNSLRRVCNLKPLVYIGRLLICSAASQCARILPAQQVSSTPGYVELRVVERVLSFQFVRLLAIGLYLAEYTLFFI